ncbi:ferredoxin [Falsiruegeria litorea]|uniref:ferredoxin n=1 Tax=Falsiruegeria litorea TaxID=1280831 RepID=UPI001BFDA908|nr:ferredoxin [Falsiruegeria litorea]MBT8168966.1 ferredoxin [Falsiruegeria litorea]
MEPLTPVSRQVTYDAIETAAGDAGLIIMGAQHPRVSEAKELNGGTLILLGAGQEFWPTLQKSPEWQDRTANPVDRWSDRVVSSLANRFGATVHFPFGGPPYTPFIDWALKSGRAFLSPVGAMVHDTVGMMISYRGALHFPQEFDIPVTTVSSPCDGCPAPCTTACPVGALNAETFYKLDTCHAYLDTDDGHPCMTNGCAARLACPVSVAFNRDPAQTAHHMKAFHPS